MKQATEQHLLFDGMSRIQNPEFPLNLELNFI